MTATTRFLLPLLAWLCCTHCRPARADNPSAPTVLLISIDGLKPDYVRDAEEHHLRIPNLRRLLAEGAHASGVVGVLPTVTYPNHTTMVTGVSPARHGIFNNHPFDPNGKNLDGWYWYAEDIRVPTLWDAASAAGLTTGSVNWPVTVGANINYNVVQYWRASTAEDRKVIRALSTPGLVSEIEREVGPFIDGDNNTVAADRRRTAFATYLMTHKHPRLMLFYLGALDEEEHRSGPYSEKSFAVLEALDQQVGELREAADRSAGGKAVVAVVSDHGFMHVDKVIHLNAALRRAGLIDLDERGRVAFWRAYAWDGCGSAAIVLRDKDDVDTLHKVQGVLDRLVADQGGGILRVIDGPEAHRMGGFPDASMVAILRAGYTMGPNLSGSLYTRAGGAGTHGYAPEHPEMEAAFLMAGPGVPRRDLGRIHMYDIAPTLAGILGIPLPSADGRDVLRGGGTPITAQRDARPFSPATDLRPFVPPPEATSVRR